MRLKAKMRMFHSEKGVSEMEILVEVDKNRVDLFDESDEYDISLLKREIEYYYGFKTNYVFRPERNEIVFYNVEKVEKLKKEFDEIEERVIGRV